MTKRAKQKDVNSLMNLSMMEYVIGGSGIEECAGAKTCKEGCFPGCRETCANTKRDGTAFPPTDPPTNTPVW